MSSWLQRVVVTIHMSDDSGETLKYASFLADTYGATLDVMSVTRCAKHSGETTDELTSTAALVCDGCHGQGESLSLEQRRAQIAGLLAALPSKAAREAKIEIGEPTEIEAALKRKRYDLAILDDRCGRRCTACCACPVLDALKDCPSCGMMRVEGSVQLPLRE